MNVYRDVLVDAGPDDLAEIVLCETVCRDATSRYLEVLEAAGLDFENAYRVYRRTVDSFPIGER